MIEKPIIKILGENYNVIDSIEKISIADSFVLPKNKIGDGNGEAKLYVGQVGEKLESFFGQRGFIVECFFSKQNLIDYLNSSYSEYNAPVQNYKNKDRLPLFWEENKNAVMSLDLIVPFTVRDQNQISGPRLYVNAFGADGTYKLLRQLALPIISHINIYKLYSEVTDNYKFYFKLFLNESDDILELNIGSELIDDEVAKFIPLSDDNIEIEKDDVSDPQTKQKTEKETQIPFDPNNIRIRIDPSTIGQVKNDLEHGIINLNTEFQRLPNLWDENKMSRFIESLLLRLPIPAFYFNEAENNQIEVVDGLQRISTIKRFILDKNGLKLKNLEFLKNFDGLGYNDLEYTYQRRILMFPITTYIIEKGTPDEVKFNIFKRVNTGGLELTTQEIRHAINQGKAASLLAELVDRQTPEGKSFHRATDNKMLNSRRMEDRDFANRFVSFYVLHYKTYKPDLDTFLNKGLSAIKDLEDNNILSLKNKFRISMDLAYDIFGKDAFRKRLNETDNRKPINKSIFDALSVSLARLPQEKTSILNGRKEIFKRKFIELNNEFLFLRAITQGTAQKESVTKRFEEIERIINETINNHD